MRRFLVLLVIALMAPFPVNASGAPDRARASRAVAVTAAPVLALQAAALASNWSVRDAGLSIAHGEWLTLVNARGGAIGYGSRRYGINLVWGSFRDNIRFERSAGPGTISYDDAVAIYVRGHGYLKYQSRSYGINLVWSSSPAYQWRIRGGTTGITVAASQGFDLYNTVEADYVIYCSRSYGIDLRWQRDCPTADPDAPRTATVYMRRQPVWEGHIPYLGTFGPISGGARIVKINFPRQYPAVVLVKPGRTTQECGNPDAVVVVHGDMTPSQMRQVWGSSNIVLSGSRRLSFVGCTTSTTPLLNALPVNVTWVRP